MTTRSRLALILGAATIGLGVAFAPIGASADDMKKDDGMKKTDSMSQDNMKKDDMAKDGMKKDDMSKDSMKKDDGMKKN
jgi:pentapeptide MXKDX repeat protein